MDWLIKKDKKKEHYLDHYYYEKEKAELLEDDEKLLKDYNNAKDYAKVYKGENVMYEGIATYQDESVYLSTETLKKVMPKIKGRPVIVEHKAGITPNNMEKYAVGYVTGEEYNNETGRFDVDFVIWNDEAKELLDNKGYTLSTSYVAREFTNGSCCINTPYENEITDLDFTHLAIVKNPRYEKVKVYENSKEEGEYGNVEYADMGYQEDKKPRYPIDTEKHVRAALSYFGMPKNRAKYTKEQIEKIQARIDKAKEKFKIGEEKENGFITLDEVDEDGKRKVIWIPNSVHYVPPKERNRVYDICENHKQGNEPKYDFSHTRVKPTTEQIQYLKNTVKEIQEKYNFKGIAQVEISSSLNSGSWGVCFAPQKASLISLAPSLYKENAQTRYDESVKEGFHPKGTGECIKSVLVHEIGHSITVNSNNKEFWSEIDSVRSKYMKDVKKGDIKNPDHISEYARENKYEFVAEAFCQGHLSKKYGKYTKEVMEIMDKHFKKGYQQKLAFDNEAEDTDMWIEEYGFGYPIDEDALKEMEEKNKKARKRAEKQNCIISLKEEYNNMEKIEVSKGFMAGLLNLAGKVFNNACKEEGIEEIDDKIEEKDDKKTDKKDEKKNDKVDKRKLIDEVGGILKGKVDEEVWRTVIGKIEKASYDEPEFKGDEKDKKDNKKEEKNNSIDYYEMMNAKVNALQKAPEKHYSSFDALQNGAEIYGKKGV